MDNNDTNEPGAGIDIFLNGAPLPASERQQEIPTLFQFVCFDYDAASNRWYVIFTDPEGRGEFTPVLLEDIHRIVNHGAFLLKSLSAPDRMVDSKAFTLH